MPNLPSEELSQLLARIALRDRAAFRTLHDACAPKLFGICLRLLRDRREAEDALQEIFVKIWHGADRFAATVGNPSAWLNAVARNHAIDRLRQRKARHDELETARALADPAPGPEAQAITSDDGGASTIALAGWCPNAPRRSASPMSRAKPISTCRGAMTCR